MCGRFGFFSALDRIMDRFGIDRVEYKSEPRYNIAPDTTIAVIVQEDGERVLKGMRWGLIPFWSDEPDTEYSTINARTETISSKPAFRVPFKKRRCLIPVDGFYEWEGPAGSKTPYFVRLKGGEPFAFPGLWDRWTDEEGEREILSATLTTTEPNAEVRPIHDRMPVILERDEESIWLDPESEEDELLALLDPFPDGRLEVIEVSREVNDPENEGPHLILRA